MQPFGLESNSPSPGTRSQQPKDDRSRLKLRVCDNCRIKKIKCDMGAPTCSACCVRGAVCTYSKHRRKPGPPKRRAAYASSLASSGSTSCSMPDVHDASSVSLTNPHSLAADMQTYSSVPMMIPDISSDVEDFLLELYMHHVQPVYPLLHSNSPESKYGISKMSHRLKMAIYSVASLFASSTSSNLSPEYFAKRAEQLGQGDELTMDEIKASILLCLHDISSYVSWGAVAEIARITRMADLYRRRHMGKRKCMGDSVGSPSKQSADCDAEEWRSVWWCIYGLDTRFSAIAAVSHAIGGHIQGEVALPVVSIPQLTNHQHQEGRRDHSNDSQLTLSPKFKLWETMEIVFSRSPCRTRNLYLGACTFMRSITELRATANQSHEPSWQARFREIESDCAAAMMFLPSWVFNPARNTAIQEPEIEHRERLETLLVWNGAYLILAILAARLDMDNSVGLESSFQDQWHIVISRATELLRVVQNRRPDSFHAIDPISSHIIFIGGVTFTIDHSLKAKANAADGDARSSTHVDLLFLYLCQIGRYWPMANRLAEGLRGLWDRNIRCCSHKYAFEVLFDLLIEGNLLQAMMNGSSSFVLSELEKTEQESTVLSAETAQGNQCGEEFDSNALVTSWDAADFAPDDIDLALDWDAAFAGPDQILMNL